MNDDHSARRDRVLQRLPVCIILHARTEEMALYVHAYRIQAVVLLRNVNVFSEAHNTLNSSFFATYVVLAQGSTASVDDFHVTSDVSDEYVELHGNGAHCIIGDEILKWYPSSRRA